MSEKLKDDGYPAFPTASDQCGHYSGLTRREYFATKAMQGICVNAGRNEFSLNDPATIAESAYAMADAMLKVGGK